MRRRKLGNFRFVLKLENCYSSKYGLSVYAYKETDGGYYLNEKISVYQECCICIRK